MGFALVFVQDFDFLKWIYCFFDEQHHRHVSTRQLGLIIRKSPIEVVQWMHEHELPFTIESMDQAASLGRMEIVKSLHENTMAGCTTSAKNDAARNGYLEVDRFLHENRTEGCKVKASNDAARNGHVDVVQFPLANQREKHPYSAFPNASKKGHLDIVRFLHESYWINMRAELAITRAAYGGHLYCSEHMHEQNMAGFTIGAINATALGGHLKVVKFLHEDRT